MSVANSIFLLGLIFLAVSMMAGAYIWRRQAVAIGAIAGWLLIAIFGFSQSTATWDILYGMGWFATGLLIVSAIEAVGLKESSEIEYGGNAEEDELNKYLEEKDKYLTIKGRFRMTTAGRKKFRRLRTTYKEENNELIENMKKRMRKGEK